MYMKTHTLTNQEVALLFSLRSKTVKSFKANFSKLNNKNTTCPFCDTEDDTQEHALNCDEMNNDYNYTYNNILNYYKVGFLPSFFFPSPSSLLLRHASLI